MLSGPSSRPNYTQHTMSLTTRRDMPCAFPNSHFPHQTIMFNILAGIRCTPTNNSKQGSPMMVRADCLCRNGRNSGIANLVPEKLNKTKFNNLVFRKKKSKNQFLVLNLFWKPVHCSECLSYFINENHQVTCSMDDVVRQENSDAWNDAIISFLLNRPWWPQPSPWKEKKTYVCVCLC